ncbi:hypothetical protein [Gordonia alkaliphila]
MNTHDYDQIITDAATGARLRLTLVRAVEAASGLPWDAARLGWRVIGVCVDEEAAGICVCGQTGLRYLYTITDNRSGAELYPIGSGCIAHFGDLTMASAASDFADIALMRAAITIRGTLDLTRDLTRRKLALLHWSGLLNAREVEFLTSMFNRRRPMTPSQARWVESLLGRVSRQLRSPDRITSPEGVAVA